MSLSARARNRRIWQFVALVTGAVLLTLAFRDPLRDIVDMATRNVDLDYVFLVPALAMYLAWIRRSRWRTWRSSPSWWGFLVVVLAIVLAWCGRNYDVLVAWHIGYPIAIAGFLAALFGPSIWRSFGPAFLMLCAISPVPGGIRQSLAVPLQKLASTITATLLEFFNVPVEVAGNLIEINGVAVAVGEACNGMRFMIPLLLIIFTLVFSLPLKASARVLLIIGSIPLALLVNVVRLIPTAIAYGYFPEWSDFVYQLSGWVMIPMAILVILGMLWLLETVDIPVAKWRLVTA